MAMEKDATSRRLRENSRQFGNVVCQLRYISTIDVSRLWISCNLLDLDKSDQVRDLRTDDIGNYSNLTHQFANRLSRHDHWKTLYA